MSNSQIKSQKLEDRMMNHSINIIEICNIIPDTQENKIISNQLIRSVTSIGANYTEANNASSRLDFRNKIFIAKKEAAESRYWLKLLAKINKDIEFSKQLDETSQQLFILQKIVSTLKNGK